jgi:vacuolar-type H+-ATPase subunit E/Vma4
VALEDIQNKILDEARASAAQIASAADQAAAEKVAAAEKRLQAERQKALAELAGERARALQQRRQLLLMETSQSALALKREYLQKVLALAVEQIVKKKLKEYYVKIFKTVDFQGARILAGGDPAPVAAACKASGVSAEIIPQPDWPAGRLEVDYGRSRLDCSLALYAQELAQTLESALAERLWP